MNILNFKHFAVAVLSCAALQFGLVSCSDDPGVENYYTSTSQYATDYLMANGQFSEYTKILERATGEKGTLRLLQLLGSYGSYTVFAPTNDAVYTYLASKGVSSVEELSKEDCDTIALNSIIENAYFTTDVNNGTYPQTNMLDQYLTISSDSDTVSVPGQVLLAMTINKEALIIHADDSVSNGVVHTINKLIFTSTEFISDFLDNDENCTLYNAALKATGVNELLKDYIDPTYSVGSDSIDWTNDALVMPTAVEYDNVAYPEKRFFKFTMFICTDKVLKEKYNITTLDDLRAKAHELYDPVYPDDKNITDERDRRNALNRFISYHILNRYADYYKLTCVDGPNSTLAVNWNRRKWDISDWYETMMPYSILKCSYPNGSQAGLYINRRGVQSRADERGVFVRGAKVTPEGNMGISTNKCLNGIYHYIDDIIAYDQNTQQVVLNERMRIDASTLSPDFMNCTSITGSPARGCYTRTTNENGKYGTGDATSNHNNKQTCLGFKAGFVKNFKYDNNTHLHVRPRTLHFWSYQGDEVTILGIFDFSVKIPPVPAGTYEVRLFTCVAFDNRGIIQVYIDDIPQGIPFDMRPGGVALFGWKSDDALGDEDAVASFDKSIHNLGWMKGPKSYFSATSESGGNQGTCFRDAPNTIRKVLGTFVSDGKTDHYLRFQQKLKSTSNAMNFDFLEICPSSVYNNEYYAEDRW